MTYTDLSTGQVQDQQSKAFLTQFSQQSMLSQDLLDNSVESFSNFLVSAALSAAGPANKPNGPRQSDARNWKCRKSSKYGQT